MFWYLMWKWALLYLKHMGREISIEIRLELQMALVLLLLESRAARRSSWCASQGERCLPSAKLKIKGSCIISSQHLAGGKSKPSTCLVWGWNLLPFSFSVPGLGESQSPKMWHTLHDSLNAPTKPGSRLPRFMLGICYLCTKSIQLSPSSLCLVFWGS